VAGLDIVLLSWVRSGGERRRRKRAAKVSGHTTPKEKGGGAVVGMGGGEKGRNPWSKDEKKVLLIDKPNEDGRSK